MPSLGTTTGVEVIYHLDIGGADVMSVEGDDGQTSRSHRDELAPKWSRDEIAPEESDADEELVQSEREIVIGVTYLDSSNPRREERVVKVRNLTESTSAQKKLEKKYGCGPLVVTDEEVYETYKQAQLSAHQGNNVMKKESTLLRQRERVAVFVSSLLRRPPAASNGS